MDHVTRVEKVTINLGVVDLGRIDLLVQEGFFSNRTDLIRTAVRSLLQEHREALGDHVRNRTLTLGVETLTAARLQDALRLGEQLDLRVLGLVVIADDVSPEIAAEAIGSIEVLGVLQASPAVKRALKGRVK